METSRPPKLNSYRNIGFTGSVSPATKRKLDKWETEELQCNVATASWMKGGGQEAAGGAIGPFSPVRTHPL